MTRKWDTDSTKLAAGQLTVQNRQYKTGSRATDKTMQKINIREGETPGDLTIFRHFSSLYMEYI
jgi:hypothetical protein